MFSGIEDRAAPLNDSARSKAGRLPTAQPHDVENGLPAGDEIIANDAPVAAPPHGFRTHDRTAPFAPLLKQMLEAREKLC